MVEGKDAVTVYKAYLAEIGDQTKVAKTDPAKCFGTSCSRTGFVADAPCMPVCPVMGGDEERVKKLSCDWKIELVK